MSQKPYLAIANTSDREEDDPFAELYDQLSFDGGDGNNPTPQPTIYRHQLLHFDFWFIAGAIACQLTIMTSFVPMNLFEPLVVATIVLLFMALVSNLTREKQGVIVHETKHRWAINIRLPWHMYIPPKSPLCERIDW